MIRAKFEDEEDAPEEGTTKSLNFMIKAWGAEEDEHDENTVHEGTEWMRVADRHELLFVLAAQSAGL